MIRTIMKIIDITPESLNSVPSPLVVTIIAILFKYIFIYLCVCILTYYYVSFVFLQRYSNNIRSKGLKFITFSIDVLTVD